MFALKRDLSSNMLPALAYAEDEKIFLLEKNSIGFGFVCQPMYGADDSAGERLNVLLNQDWPVNTILQVCLWTSPDIENTLFAYTNESINEPGLLGSMRKERAKFLREKTDEPLHGAGNLMVRNIQMIVTVKVPTKKHLPSDKEMEDIGALRRTTRQALETAGVRGIEDMTPGIYIRIMSSILNQGKDASWRGNTSAEWDKSQVIREQVFDYDTTLEVDRKGLWINDVRVKTLSIKRYPEYSILGMARRFLTEPLNGNRGIRERAMVTATLVFPDTESARANMEKERQWVTNQAYGPMLKWSPRLADKKHSFDTLFEALDDGDRVVKIYVGLTLFTTKETEDAAVSNARSYWREGNYQLMEDRYLCMPLFLNNLPFGAEREVVKDLFRYKTMATRHAITQLPLFGGWQGTGSPILNFICRDGQLANVCLFDSATNYNLVIAARSGSGKSFLTNEIIISYLSIGGRAWIIDVGRSYVKLCNHLGGQFMEFGPESEVCLNPFSVIEDFEEEVDMLAGIIANMAAPAEPLSNYQNAGLRRVLGECWAIYGRELSIDLLAEHLKQDSDLRIRDIGEQLFSFTSKGEYGRFFNGRNNVEFSDRLAVLELEELKGKKHLQQVVLLQMIHQISTDVFKGKRDRRKVLVIDEAWDLLKRGDIADFIEAAVRRFRKYGGALIICTQSLNDLYNNPNGVAIAENSAFKFLLGQNKETVMQLKEQKRVDIGDYGFELLRTVHTLPGQYSEIFMIADQSVAVTRLYVEPFKQLLYSTSPKDVHEIDTLLGQGYSLDQAINEILRRRKLATTSPEKGGVYVSLPVDAVVDDQQSRAA